MERREKILVAPLDWGLGHATRCIPIIRGLQNRGCEVLIASSGRALKLLQKEFPQVKTFELVGYNPQYPAGGSMVFAMAKQLPRFLRTISKEQSQIEKIISRNEINVVVSDNRYGCFSKEIKSIIITHQLNIQMPKRWKWLEKTVNKYNDRQLKKFTECWVPSPPASIILTLTQASADLNVRYIGYVSRFEKKFLEKKFDVCAICSGPEPQRSIFEKLLTDQLKKSDLTAILIRGKTEVLNPYFKQGEQLTIANYLTTEDLNEVIEQSETVIARSGYSTVMDLAKLKKNAVLIPTPFQTEQELIAEELERVKIAYCVKQKDFDLQRALNESKNYSGFSHFEYNETLFEKALDSLL